MKKIVIILLAFLGISSHSFSQEYTDAAPYTKDSSLQNFQIQLLDSSTIGIKDRFAGKPLVLVYFSPECGHCQEMSDLWAKKMSQFKGVNIIYSWFNFPFSEIQTFRKKYHLANFNNVTFGRDPDYSIPCFYRVEYTPTVAVYNKDGKLVEVLRMGITVDKIAKALGIDLM